MSWLFEPERPWRPLDAALAAGIARRWPQVPAPTLRLLARASFATGEGHSALDPSALAGGDAFGLPDWPRERWLDALAACPAVGGAGDARPFVLDDGLLYLRRFHRDEVVLAQRLRVLAQPQPMPAEAAAVRTALAALFPDTRELQADRQVLACALSLRARLTVILGGPGTGKTTTVARLIALHRQLAGAPLRTAVAAPTGKAAARVGEAMAAACARMELAPELLAAFPERAQTLHRLLGADRSGTRFRYGPERPLPYELIVLDEASMVDLGLFARLLAAVGPATRLVVLGDPDQLEAVESGAVLAELAGTADAQGNAAMARAGAVLAGAADDADPAIAGCVIRLARGYRFAAGSAIGRLSAAVVAGDEEAVRELVAQEHADLRYRPQAAAELRAALRAQARALYGDLGAAADPVEALALHAGARMLCATRGEVADCNRRLAEALGLGAPAHVASDSLPFLVTRNDALRGLYNGDTGIFKARANGALRACLLDGDRLRDCAVHEIGPWQPALAMTVHRAQGSEYERVLLALPAHSLPLLSRQWLYTAITRARAHVELWAPPQVLAQAVRRRAVRVSGLGRRLTAP